METISEKANNAAKEEKKEFDFVEATLVDGTPIKVAKQTILDIMKDEIEKTAMQDNVFIMYHQNSDNFPLLARLEEWSSLQKEGEIAEGVFLREGGKNLVISPTESKEPLYWSTANLLGGGFCTLNRIEAINDWEGKNNTISELNHAECNNPNCAAGYCAGFEKLNANQKGLDKGKWWLPSLAESIMIFSNLKKINFALSLITNGQPIGKDSWYWTSTERNEISAYGLKMDNANIILYYGNYLDKSNAKLRVRPVSNFYM